jgi:hypothetical protein
LKSLYSFSDGHSGQASSSERSQNGFRGEWGAETYAAFRSVLSKAKANGAAVLETVRCVLAENLPDQRIATLG